MIQLHKLVQDKINWYIWWIKIKENNMQIKELREWLMNLNAQQRVLFTTFTFGKFGQNNSKKKYVLVGNSLMQGSILYPSDFSYFKRHRET